MAPAPAAAAAAPPAAPAVAPPVVDAAAAAPAELARALAETENIVPSRAVRPSHKVGERTLRHRDDVIRALCGHDADGSTREAVAAQLVHYLQDQPDTLAIILPQLLPPYTVDDVPAAPAAPGASAAMPSPPVAATAVASAAPSPFALPPLPPPAVTTVITTTTVEVSGIVAHVTQETTRTIAPPAPPRLPGLSPRKQPVRISMRTCWFVQIMLNN